MKPTEQQRTLYAAIGAGKEVRYTDSDYPHEPPTVYDGNPHQPPLGDEGFLWEIIDPDTITVSYKIPKPLTEAPKIGEKYFLTTHLGRVESATWRDDELDRALLAAFNCFATREDAEAAHTARTAAYRKALGV
jgi:hypothetical protein